METLKRESVSNAERMDGPRLPPAPMRITFLMEEDISEVSVDITRAWGARIESERILLLTVRGLVVMIFKLGTVE